MTQTTSIDQGSPVTFYQSLFYKGYLFKQQWKSQRLMNSEMSISMYHPCHICKQPFLGYKAHYLAVEALEVCLSQ